MKNYGDLGGCYSPQPTGSTDNTLLDLHNSSRDTQPHSLILLLFYCNWEEKKCNVWVNKYSIYHSSPLLRGRCVEGGGGGKWECFVGWVGVAFSINFRID